MSVVILKVFRQYLSGINWFTNYSKCPVRRRSKLVFIPYHVGAGHSCRNLCSRHELLSFENPVLLNHINSLVREYDSEQSTQSKALSRQSFVDLIKKREDILKDLKSLDDLKSGNCDRELQKLCQEEYSTYQTELKLLDEQILEELVPRPKYEYCNDIIIEVLPGAGGQEAMLFAGELFNLYERYCMINGWKFLIDSVENSDLGGIKSAVAYVSGSGSFYYLQNEIGVHRVQRRPITEKSGRVHTSTAAVSVIPQPSEVDITLQEKDLHYEFMRASGPGGQNVNKTESAVRLKHLPSGVFVECSTSRSQIENRELALMKLRAKLFANEEAKQTKEIQLARQSQLGNRDRSEKIRTYNFPQDRITDHRYSLSVHNIKSFMEAGKNFQDLLDKLNKSNRLKQFSDFVAKLSS